MRELPSVPHKYSIADPTDRLPFQSTVDGGGKGGYIYTRRGGFIDLGHARDYIDATRVFADVYDSASRGNRPVDEPVVYTEGEISYLTIETPLRERPSPVLAALMGAKLAYERAIWHEIVTYFPDIISPNQQYSSFAPEDNFSNALGVLAGYKVMLTTKTKFADFDQAADNALIKLLESLEPATKQQTLAAIEYVKDVWWDSSFFTTIFGRNALKRNFDAFGPIKPWLVTDIAIPNKKAKGDELRNALGRPKAANIEIPTHYRVLVLHKLGQLEIRNAHSSINALVPHLAGRIKSSDFPTLVDAIRVKERQTNRIDADSPGPPAP